MNEQQLKDWRETALYVEQERLRMLKEADKEQRRERLATAIMAGIYANPAHAAIDDKMAALCAIDGADALIKALERYTEAQSK